MYRLDHQSADCLVFTYKEGLLAAVAHDLKIKVSRFRIDVDEVARAVQGRFDAASLRVVCAMRDGAESPSTLSAEQKREIQSNIARDVLASEDHPEIRYVSTAIDADGDGFRIQGHLSLHGKRRKVGISVRKERNCYVARARVHQPDFGIRPYSAMLGTLKVSADVDIQIVVPWPLRDATQVP